MSGAREKIRAIAVVVSALMFAAPAGAAYQEAHQTGDDVRIAIDGAGRAQVEHTIRYRVVSGTLQKFDLRGIDPGAVVAPAVTITADDGKELAAYASAEGERALRVSVAEPKGIKRGLYTFRVRYEVDLVAARALVRDGAMWRFSWASPIATEGYDSARVVLSLPAAPTEPRPIKLGAATASAGVRSADDTWGSGLPRDGEGGEDGVLSTLRRAPDKDELELVRPHVARGEAVVWAARLDPKSFPGVRTPDLRPAAPLPPPEPNRLREVGFGAALLAFAIAFGALVSAKAGALAEGCARVSAWRPATAAALVPIHPTLRACVAATALAVGIALQAVGLPTAGAALVAIAMLLAISRVVSGLARPRGPGRWLALRPADALDRKTPAQRGDWLDIGTRTGKCTALLLTLGAAALAIAARPLSAEASYLVILDALVLVPIFVTGCSAHLPPDPSRAPIEPLGRLFRRLGKDRGLKVAPWARIPNGCEAADELRLLVLPRASMPGLVGVEVGVAWASSVSGYLGSPEVLVRVQDGSAAAAKMAALAPSARAIPGRKPEERVIRLSPGLPGADATRSLVQRVAKELRDRRMAIPSASPPARLSAWKGVERRLPPNERVKAEAPRAA